MNLVFYAKTTECNNYHECFVSRSGPRSGLMKGCGGAELLITITNGLKIKTNDLWYINYNVKLPENSIIGTVSIYCNEIVDETIMY